MRKFALVLCTVVVSAPAHAHWQWTRWGMSPDQLVASSKGSAQRVDPASDAKMPFGVKEAVGTYSSNGRPMKASYWFDTGKLTQVDLSSDNQDHCNGIRRDLTAVYGTPVSVSRMSTVWLDKAKGNRVQFVDWGVQGCDLIYAPIPTSGSTGL